MEQADRALQSPESSTNAVQKRTTDVGNEHDEQLHRATVLRRERAAVQELH